jgi:dolichol kinase
LFFYKKNIFNGKSVSYAKPAEIQANAINMKSSSSYVASMVGKKTGRKKSQRRRWLDNKKTNGD